MSATPRILALVGSRVLFGQERANLLVLETLKADGCEILAVLEDHPAFRTMPEQLDRRGIPFHAMPAIGRREPGYLFDFLWGNSVRYVAAKRTLKKLIREFKPTHIHVPNPFAFLMAAAAAPLDLPIIYRIGDIPATHNAMWRWIWRRITQRVDHFVADSNYVANCLVSRGVPCDRVTVIYSAPPKRAHSPQPGRPPNCPHHILFLGQLTAEKGADRLIQAFRLIAPQYPEARLVLAGRMSGWHGDHWARALCDATLRDPVLKDRVDFIGEVEDIYAVLASAAFIVIPSIWDEPFGIVCVEAKAAARPAVVTPKGGLPEQIEHGVDGFICADMSVESLAEGLRYYLADADRARAHGRAALASLQRYRVDEFASRWRRVYALTDHGSSRRKAERIPPSAAREGV